MCFAYAGNALWALRIFLVGLLVLFVLSLFISRAEAKSSSYLCTKCLKQFSFHQLVKPKMKLRHGSTETGLP